MNRIPQIALAGNPNVGKTTLFNALTGAHQHVGNWPGVTVEHKSGTLSRSGKSYDIIDLPGIYSLSAQTPDERIAREYILNQQPDLVINIVDASNLERNLYLTTQLMEMQTPMLLVLSMTDLAAQNGISIDYDHLSSHLGYPVFPVILNKSFEIGKLISEIDRALANPSLPAIIHYDEVVETCLKTISNELINQDKATNPRWTALKLIEGDAEIRSRYSVGQLERFDKEINQVLKHRGQNGDAIIADDRYGFIRGLVKDVVKRQSVSQHTFSDRLDKIALNSILGLPVFFGVMYLVFLVAVRLSQPVIDLIDTAFSYLFVEQFAILLQGMNLPEWITLLLSEGLGGGVTTIATFTPPIFFIFVCLSILEDSGYMARAAFIADKFMRRIGLPGKAFIPLIVGFGCTVPAIMATRTLESKRDRIFASLLTPFISCGAKLPVYTFLVLLFFSTKADIVIFSLYMTGVAMALLTGLLLRKTIFKSEPGNFVMELPPYHIPTWRGIFLHTWHRLKDFVLRASKTILLAIILINILQVITLPDPYAVEADGERITVLELSGKLISPIMKPMGLTGENWQASVALVSGIFAKEAVVGTIQSLYQDGNSESDASIRQAFGSWQSAYAFLLFVLLYSPCVAALAMLFREHGKVWLIFSLVYLTLLAWIIAVLFYQISVFNAMSVVWIGICLLLIAAIYFVLNYLGKRMDYALR